jgi:serine/threonine-protein kinase HipA
VADGHVEVWVELADGPVLVGRMHCHRRRQTESATFAYEDSWVGRPGAYPIDPQLPLASGAFQTAARQAIFPAISDTAPDSWGRRLILRNERRRTEREGGSVRSLREIDLVLGVRDDLRQGALRFRLAGDPVFQAPEEAGIPQLVNLPRLLQAAANLENDRPSDEDLELLLHAGSSLGGARPKAHVIDPAGRLAIAKFPRPTLDSWDVQAWEKLALTLAERSGINTPASELIEVDGSHILIVYRFDRAGPDGRIGYVSAMTLLETSDNEPRSYLDIAAVIEENSPEVERDLHEIWRRIALSVLISNSDDHLRNHGFLHDGRGGWALSPIFDVNPDPTNTGYLTTAITDADATASIDNLLDVAALFRLNSAEAHRVLGEVHGAVSTWRHAAREIGISTDSIDSMEPAFAKLEQANPSRIAS